MKNTNLLKTPCISMFIMLGSLISSLAAAENAVIVHPSNAVSLSEKDIQRLFLGKQKSFPGGGEAIPVDQHKGSSAREAFFSSVLGKSEQQTKAYWSRLVFTGKGAPPKVVGDSLAVKEIITNNPSTIGYIDASVVDESVRVVYIF